MLCHRNKSLEINYYKFNSVKGKIINFRQGDLVDVLLIDELKVLPVRLFTYIFPKVSDKHPFRDRVDKYIYKKRLVKRMKTLLQTTHNEVYLYNTRFEEDGYLWTELYLDLGDEENLVSRIEK